MNLMIRRMIRTIPVAKVEMILVVTRAVTALAMKKKIPAQKSRRKEAAN